ncbi:COG3650 family protein [Rhodovulum sp. 12E13]|uniref:COG3650 family protein n=1 Tax=Rhodovulum sp. 12E13 TaxID=2203891 RepID=UPI00131410D8|nr:SH3 domain-containing protein [Rhodovulum sp. 12E13]
MRRAALFALILAAGPAPAQEFVPRLYDVAGVAEGDVLNVRAAPSASAEVVATLPPDRRRVEVIGLDDGANWGRIGLPEGEGWVSLAFLERRYLGEAGMAPGMRCIGTEPFWSVTFGEGGATWSSPGEERSFGVAADRSAPSSDARVYGWAETGAGATLSGSVVAASCSDGMSDRPWGWVAGIVRRTGGEVELLSGCCTLSSQ